MGRRRSHGRGPHPCPPADPGLVRRGTGDAGNRPRVRGAAMTGRWHQALRPGDGEEGSALVEFVFLAVVMLVPIVYLIVTLARIQAGTLAVEQASREAGR